MRHKIRELLIHLEVDFQLLANINRALSLEFKLALVALLFMGVPITYLTAQQMGVVTPITEVIAPKKDKQDSLDNVNSSLPNSGADAESNSQQGEQTTGTGSGPTDNANTGNSSGSAGGSSSNNPTAPNIPLFQSYCLARTGNIVNINGLIKNSYRNVNVSANTIFNASNGYWDGTRADGSRITWVIVLDGQGSSCWYGGKYTGVWDDRSPSVTWENPYHHAGAMTIRMSNFLVEGLRAHNQGDGVRMESGGSNFHIRGVYMSDIHDDCVENDFLHSGITEDSLFNGCYSGFSAASNASKSYDRDGSNNTWHIKNNLVYMKPFPTVHSKEFFLNRGCPIPNHGILFKGWNSTYDPAPKVVFKDNIIRYDIRPCVESYKGIIPSQLDFSECRNNIIVYLGPGEFPGKAPAPCFKVTKDINVWNNAVKKWKQTHPEAAN